MSATRSVRSRLAEHACLQCQRRKTKCIENGDGQPCSYCARSGKTCTFTGRPIRTPLTRQNLDAAEERCRVLEAMLGSTRATIPASTMAENEPSAHVQTRTQHSDGRSSTQFNISGRNSPSPYEWNENPTMENSRQACDPEKTRDGMASLGGKAAGTGYLGASSGNHMLESVTSLLPHGEQGVAQVPQKQSSAELIAAQGLSAGTIHGHLVDAYFTRYNSSYPILHERSFRNECKTKSRISKASTWHILYFMVLAIGGWVSDLSEDEHSMYYDAARARFGVETMESGTICNVQAFLLMGNYLQKHDRPNTGYNYVGLAYRTALGLGLHREATRPSDRSRMANHRRRVLFWTLYCFDSGFSLTTGRPIMVSDSCIDVPVPLNIDDTALAASDSVPADAKVPYPTTYSILIAQSRLAKIANRVYHQFMTNSHSADLDHQTSTMESMLHNWRTSLPAYFTSEDSPAWFQGPCQVLYWKQANIHMLLLHASRRLQTDDNEKAALGVRCSVVAAHTISDIAEFCSRRVDLLHPGLRWYAVYFLLQATLALSADQLSRATDMAILDNQKEENLRSYEGAAVQAYECLDMLSHSSTAAARSLQVLLRLRQNVKNVSTSPEARGISALSVLGAVDLSTTQLGGSSQPNLIGTPNSCHYTQVSDHPSMGPDELSINLNAAISGRENAADPSLHTFFDPGDDVHSLFQGFQGFPSTVEHGDFAYQTTSTLAVDREWTQTLFPHGQIFDNP